jgi:UDP-N-acetylglucosamine--N-acetylmuramyl-(pentapeptide) pyrophosphoryl-undecaprenol N-acetylglucosamine transferase
MLATLWQLPAACWRAFRILQQFQPAVAYGVGGYVSGPVLLMAAMRGIPIVIHEANAVPGFANRRLAPLVNRALLAESAAAHYFPAGRAVLAGMPVADEFFHIPARQHRPPYNILVTGGSLGSSRLNRAVTEALPALAARQDLYVVHQSGEKECEAMKQAFAASGAKGEVAAFLRDMPQRMAAADLVVCRAGASTLAELAAAGKAALLVPFPFASDDHQWHNAMARQRAGAARVVRDQELDGARLLGEIDAMLPELAALESAMRRFAVPDATRRIVEAIESVTHVL